MPEAHRDHRTATPGAPRSTTYGHDPYQALSVFLCAPQAVDAVNRYVSFDGYATTFELAETEVAPAHWSRR